MRRLILASLTARARIPAEVSLPNQSHQRAGAASSERCSDPPNTSLQPASFCSLNAEGALRFLVWNAKVAKMNNALTMTAMAKAF